MKMSQEGADFSTIATELNRTPESVRARYSRYLRRTLPTTKYHVFTQGDDDIIIQRKCQRVPLASIARELNCPLIPLRNRWYSVLRFQSESLPGKDGVPPLRLPSGLNFTEARELIVQRIQEGHTRESIAKELKCSIGVVAPIYASVYRPRNANRSKTYSDREIELIKRRRSAGASIVAVAHELGRSPWSLNSFLCYLRATGGLPNSMKRFTPAENKQILELCAKNTSFEAIGEMLGRSAISIRSHYQRLRQNGAPPARPSRRARWTSAEVDEMLRQYDTGVAVKQIARSFGRYPGNTIMKLNFELFRRGRPPIGISSPASQHANLDVDTTGTVETEPERESDLADKSATVANADQNSRTDST